MTEPRIIRTPAELEAEDPDTVCLHPRYNALICTNTADADDLPLFVVVEGEQIRAALEALNKEPPND